ncbi:MAG TPA: metal ABC transporter ATP-binding protein [Verrucomicrobiota bacterium]|nr:metal ABC transporter ATP-binding protein [Verrucomicrobiota bacterium]
MTTTSDVNNNPSYAIEIENLTVKYGNKDILKNINLKIKYGDFLAIIGPNGSGKTTLLKTILRIIKPDSGTIKIFGEEDINKIITKIGYVPQRLGFEKTLSITVREFLALRLPKTKNWFFHRFKFIDEKLKIARLGVTELLEKPLYLLSGGELQRVLIAFSLLGEPELLLLDEATEGVDFTAENLIYESLATLRKESGLTVILVSHDLSMVSRQATNVVALSNGVVCCEGSPSEVYQSLNKAYGAHFITYSHHH